MSIDVMKQALKRAFNLGQTYWSQADSDYTSQWKKADATKAAFEQLVEETCQAIEHAEQAQPVAWRYNLKHRGSFEGVSTEYSPVKLSIGENWTPLYTAPPSRKPWVGLTGDEVNEFAAGCHLGNSVQGAIRKAEAKIKEKNT